ncbi:MAG TPA: glycosyltransferase family 2 protein [Terriglobia bacterium]|nr:glycosyltransferase family 2 protein [Terriglobia bacterium]
MTSVNISAAIITLNEERNLPRALDSLARVADEVVVVDSGSTDRTREIAEQAGARFLVRSWEGYAMQKNFAAAQARHDWILSLDADEALSPALAGELERLKQAGPGDAAGFTMPRLARFRGRWIRHSGWYPDPKLRLYDRRRGRWVGRYVHEHVAVEGPVRQLKGDLLHFPADSRQEQLRSVDRYTTLAAQQAFENGERLILLKLLVFPSWKFVETYLLRRGFLDGAAGCEIAWVAGRYVCQKYEKLWRMAREGRRALESARH